jgi:hypothetical protein
MKYLCCVIIVVLGYMSVWTTVTLDHLREGKTILDTGVTPGDNLKSSFSGGRSQSTRREPPTMGK